MPLVWRSISISRTSTAAVRIGRFLPEISDGVPSTVVLAMGANGTSSGRKALLDRIEWQATPGPATATGALMKGEVDCVETPLPQLRENHAIAVDIRAMYATSHRSSSTSEPWKTYHCDNRSDTTRKWDCRQTERVPVAGHSWHVIDLDGKHSAILYNSRL